MHITRLQGLGIAPVVVAEAPAIVNAIVGLFKGSSYDATHQQIIAWTQLILADSHLVTAAAQLAWENLKCWAGDQQQVARFYASAAQSGCGCEVSHGCRADAQTAVATLMAHIPTLPPPGPLSSAPIPSQAPGYNPSPVAVTAPTVLSSLIPGVSGGSGGVLVLAGLAALFLLGSDKR